MSALYLILKAPNCPNVRVEISGHALHLLKTVLYRVRYHIARSKTLQAATGNDKFRIPLGNSQGDPLNHAAPIFALLFSDALTSLRILIRATIEGGLCIGVPCQQSRKTRAIARPSELCCLDSTVRLLIIHEGHAQKFQPLH